MKATFLNDREVQTGFLGIINSEGERLPCRVNDALDITAMEAGRMDWPMVPADVS